MSAKVRSVCMCLITACASLMCRVRACTVQYMCVSCVCVCVRWLGGCKHLRAHFVPPDDESHLAAPGINEAGPAGVQRHIVAILAAKAERGVLKGGLSSILQN